MAETNNELTLARQFAAAMAMSIFIVDPNGSLVYYNAAAERILGRTFDATGEMPASVWGRLFIPMDEHGIPLQPERLPLMIALNERRPVHSGLYIKGMDNVARHIEVTGVPLLNNKKQLLGAMAIFWD